jgi:hypothetical protein
LANVDLLSTVRNFKVYFVGVLLTIFVPLEYSWTPLNQTLQCGLSAQSSQVCTTATIPCTHISIFVKDFTSDQSESGVYVIKRVSYHGLGISPTKRLVSATHEAERCAVGQNCLCLRHIKRRSSSIKCCNKHNLSD